MMQSCNALLREHATLPARAARPRVQAEKQQQLNVTDEGLRYARLNASRMSAGILARTVAHHRQEAQKEFDAAEASEYKDEIRSDIKAWAFAVRARTAL